MSDNDHARWSEEVAAYMLGALEPQEAAALERHAAGCERCRAQVRWLTAAVDAIPESIERVEPPPELRARLLSEVCADAAAKEAGEAPPARLWQRAAAWLRGSGSGPIALRPALGLAALVLVAAVVAGYAIGGGLGDDSGGGEGTIVAGEAPGITAKMTDEGDSGTLQLAHVRQLPSDRVLQAWVQRDGEVEPVRALFVPDHEGRASTQLPEMRGVEAVMVTAEPRGGSEEPTGSPLITIPVPN